MAKKNSKGLEKSSFDDYNKRKPFHYICENCVRDWYDDMSKPIKECPYCGSCGLECKKEKGKIK